MSRRSGERRSAGARRWAWIGGVAGALAVSGALLAVLYEQGDSGPPTDKTSSDRPVEVPGDEPVGSVKPEWNHDFPADHAGQVSITVTAPDNRVREVTLTVGPWQRTVPHEGTDPVSYWFTKQGGTSPPLTVVVQPEAKVTFDEGPPPDDAEDINADWVRIG